MFDVGSAVGYLLLDTSQWESGFRAARTGLRTFTDETSTAADKWSAAGKLMGSTGKALTLGVTAPLVGLGAAAVKTAADFESTMSNLKAISGASAEDMERLTEKAQEMGATTKFSASEAGQALTYMAMAGWETQDMLDGIGGVMSLAAASGEDLASTSDIVTDALTAFGLTAKDTQMFVDVLANAANSTNTSVSLLGESFKYVAPVAGTFGYSVQDIGAALGIMANSGIKASQAGTSLRSALTRMVKPAKQASDSMEALGLYSDGVTTAMVNADGSMKPLRETMQILRDTFSELTEAEQAQAASAIFGQESMAGMLAIINASQEEFDSLIESMDNAAGTSEEMAETQLDNLTGQLTILKSGVEGAAIAFGNLLLPLIKDVVGVLQDTVDWVNNLDEDQKKLIVTIAEILVVVGPVLILLSKIISVVTALTPLISGIGTVIGLLSGPIGIVIGALALFAAAWATNFGGIRDVVTATLELIKTTVAKWSSELVEAFKKTVQWIREALSNKWKEVIEWLKGALETAKNTVLSAKSAFYNAGKAIFTALWDGLKSLWTKVSNWFREKVEWISDKVQFWNDESDKLSSSPVTASSRGSYASGLDYVPRDMDVRVHRGETIVTQEGTNDLIEAIKSIPRGGGGPMTVIVKIGDKTIKETAIDGINEASMMSGRKIITV